MWVARMSNGESVTVPDAAYVHVFVAKGAVDLDGQALTTGDAARLTDAGTLGLTASADDTEVIIWESDAQARR